MVSSKDAYRVKDKKIKYSDIPFADNQVEGLTSRFSDPGDDENKPNPSTAMLGQVIKTRKGRRALKRRKRQGL